MRNLKQVLLLLTWYDYRIHRGVAEVARELGWQLICPKGVSDRQRILRGWEGDGCIALIGSSQVLDYFHDLKIPLVDLGLTPHELPVARLATDNDAIGKLAAEHFLDHGYREVFTMPTQDVPMFKERLSFFKQYFETKGGTVTSLKQPGEAWTDFFDQLAAIALDRGTKLEELSVGFFAYEDNVAAELISVCLEKGLRVPENVAVLGVDNDDLVNAGLAVGLSSVDSDQEGLGRAGAYLLRELMKNPDDVLSREEVVRHPPKGIVTRKSTDCFAVRSPLVASALYWIHNNFHNGIQAIDVATAVGVTQQGLQKAFATHHLRSPGEEIRYQRVQAVAHHLTHSRDGLVDIAYRCGFNSVDTLITSFRKEHGMTPGKFRAKVRRQS